MVMEQGKAILLTYDTNFKYLAYTCINSMLANLKDGYTIFIARSSFEESDHSFKFDAASKRNDIAIKLITIDEEELKGLPLSYHYTISVYHRYMPLKEIYHQYGFSKVLYLDVDIIIRRDLSNLFKINLNGLMIGAVAEVRNSNLEIFGISNKERKYKTNFNTGVLLIDLVKWNHNDATNKCIDFLKKNRKKFAVPNQTEMNALFFNDWFALDPSYNLTTFYVLYKGLIGDVPYSNQQIREAKKNPHLVHFTGSLKPWHFEYYHPFKQEFKNYSREYDLYFQEQKINLKLIMKKFFFFIRFHFPDNLFRYIIKIIR